MHRYRIIVPNSFFGILSYLSLLQNRPKPGARVWRSTEWTPSTGIVVYWPPSPEPLRRARNSLTIPSSCPNYSHSKLLHSLTRRIRKLASQSGEGDQVGALGVRCQGRYWAGTGMRKKGYFGPIFRALRWRYAGSSIFEWREAAANLLGCRREV